MQTRLADFVKNTPEGQEAATIINSCVHCGFCNPACPTYRILGNELDGPRGRIYLMKSLLEGSETSKRTQLHLDRCLSCRSCESSCPSGVSYGRLVDLGRNLLETKVKRPWIEQATRLTLRTLLPYQTRFKTLLSAARFIKSLLPRQYREMVPTTSPASAWPTTNHKRTMLILHGCVQPTLAPSIDQAAASLLDQLGITAIKAPRSGCCGAISHHLAAPEEALGFMRRNIDAWWPHIEQGAEAIIITSTGCGTVVKDYGHLLKHDRGYAEKAQRVSELAKDMSQILDREDLTRIHCTPRKIAFQSPCSLQHGQKLDGLIESLLTRLGFELTEISNPNICCGSAGTYSILQQQLSNQLRTQKLHDLQQGQPELIATANIGCLTHLQAKSPIKVQHWLELLVI